MNDVISIATENPLLVLTDEAAYSGFYKKVRDEIAGFKADVSTAKGRGEIAAMAYKVTRSKTAIDAAGKKLNEDARAKINAVDASRRKIRDELDALAEEVRKPLTDWESAEKTRAEEVEAVFAAINGAAFERDNSESVRNAIEILENIELDPAILRDRLDEAVYARVAVGNHLAQALDAAIQTERDREELAKLRAEREARETAERIAREEAEKARRDAEAAEIANRNAEIFERRQREAQERAIEVARAEEKRRADEAIAKAEAEKQELIRRQELEERQRLSIVAETKRQEEARAADRAHRSKVMGAAKQAIMTCGADEETAKKIVLAVIAGEIPNVRIVF